MKQALEFGEPLDAEDEDYNFLEEDNELCISNKKLIHPDFPYTWPDEVAQFDGAVHVQEHRPNKRADFLAEKRIIALDEQIAWELKALEDKLSRLYLLRDIRNELYYICDSEGDSE